MTKKYSRYYACYFCDCTGFFAKTKSLFKFLKWDFLVSRKKLCHICNGRGYVASYKFITPENNYQSFLDH